MSCRFLKLCPQEQLCVPCSLPRPHKSPRADLIQVTLESSLPGVICLSHPILGASSKIKSEGYRLHRYHRVRAATIDRNRRIVKAPIVVLFCGLLLGRTTTQCAHLSTFSVSAGITCGISLSLDPYLECRT